MVSGTHGVGGKVFRFDLLGRDRKTSVCMCVHTYSYIVYIQYK